MHGPTSLQFLFFHGPNFQVLYYVHSYANLQQMIISNDKRERGYKEMS